MRYDYQDKTYKYDEISKNIMNEIIDVINYINSNEILNCDIIDKNYNLNTIQDAYFSEFLKRNKYKCYNDVYYSENYLTDVVNVCNDAIKDNPTSVYPLFNYGTYEAIICYSIFKKNGYVYNKVNKYFEKI